jgi:hypothetical protein
MRSMQRGSIAPRLAMRALLCEALAEACCLQIEGPLVIQPRAPRSVLMWFCDRLQPFRLPQGACARRTIRNSSRRSLI